MCCIQDRFRKLVCIGEYTIRAQLTAHCRFLSVTGCCYDRGADCFTELNRSTSKCSGACVHDSDFASLKLGATEKRKTRSLVTYEKSCSFSISHLSRHWENAFWPDGDELCEGPELAPTDHALAFVKVRTVVSYANNIANCLEPWGERQFRPYLVGTLDTKCVREVYSRRPTTYHHAITLFRRNLDLSH